MPRPVFIGIAGGTGSGKTTVARAILARVPRARAVLLEQDAYYKDQSHLPLDERRRVNYDHPAAFDTDLLVAHLDELAAGRPIEKPLYDFTTYTRTGATVRVAPADIVIVEGILVLEDARVRERLDIKLFVDTDADVRVLRRLLRDIQERGRTLESVVSQYLETVRPMHLQFVEPTRRYADLIIPEGGLNEVAIDVLVSKVQAVLAQRRQHNVSTVGS
ncbi:MAG: uridine kinase [Limnochordaceae bacterium]|nr:uridine kinase [Limnochordaceae bacterium]